MDQAPAKRFSYDIYARAVATLGSEVGDDRAKSPIKADFVNAPKGRLYHSQEPSHLQKKEHSFRLERRVFRHQSPIETRFALL
jgi:hypothetical protein